MSQDLDPTIPFDASVVDEEALRALRAVQRMLPQGDGSSNTLVGGTEAAAGLGMTHSGVSGGLGPLSGGDVLLAAQTEQAGKPIVVEPLEAPRSHTPADASFTLPEPLQAESADTSPIIVSRPAIPAPHTSSEVLHTTAAPSFDVSGVTPVASPPAEAPTVAPPASEEPKPQDHPDEVASSPVVITHNAVGNEDTAIELNLTAALADTDGSETLTVSILGVPEGASLSHGSRQPDGSWRVEPGDLARLTLIPPHDFSGTISLTLRATSHEQNGATATREVDFSVIVNVVADAPAVTVADAYGQEDTAVSLNGLSAALTDRDGSEQLVGVIISGVPAGASLSHGTRQPDGTWRVSPADLSHLVLTPQHDFSGTLNLNLQVTSREISNGSQATSQASFQVHVNALADAPIIHVEASSGLEDTAIPLNLSASLSDSDGSEVLSVLILNVPDGAVLSHGTRQPDGSWQVRAEDLADLSITPPHDFSGAINLTLHATAREQNGDVATREQTFLVTVNAVADAPSVAVADAHGQEDTLISLTGLGGALSDTDGSEHMSFVLSGVPDDASLSAGTRQEDGTWLLTSAQLAGLSLVPPAQFSGSFTLTLTAVATESQAGVPIARTSANFTVSIDPVAGEGSIGGIATGDEDTAILLQPTFALLGGDVSETWSPFTQVSAVPAGAHLSHGTEIAPGVWQVATANLQAGRVTLQPPANSDADFTLTFKASVVDTGNGKTDTREVTGTYAVVVAAVADAPLVSAHDVSGHEDQPIALDLLATLRDTDESETLAVTILGVPDGATLSHGTRQADGSWRVDPADLADLTMTPPRDFSGTINMTVRATSVEGTNGSSATTSATVHVQVEAVADAPMVSVQDASGLEDQAIALNLSAVLADTDGSEVLSVTIFGVPAGASLSHGTRQSDGSWVVGPADVPHLTLTPPHDFSGTLDLTLKAVSQENANGATATTSAGFQVHIGAVADAPVLHAADVAGDEDTAISLNLSAALADTDGSEILSVSILGVPDTASLSHGVRQPDGSWKVDRADLAGLTLTPPHDFSGRLDLTLWATAQEGANGSSATTSAVFHVSVDAVADVPVLHAGDVSGKEDQLIALNLAATLADTDGSEVLSVLILGVPEGATLSHGSRQPDGSWSLRPSDLADLTITPPHDFSGPINLTLEATARESSNGSSATTRIPFQVQVEAVADAPVITAPGATGDEDTAIPLNLSAGVTDTDGSEAISSATIYGVPGDFSLTHGIRNVDGSWSVDPADLPKVAIIPPHDFSGTVDLSVRTTSREALNGSEAETRASFQVHVNAVADAPVLVTHDASGREDQAILVDLSASLTDTDGSEVLSVVLVGMPAGSQLSAGTKNPDGSWTLTPSQLAGLTLTPPSNWSGDMTVTVQAHARETSNGSTATTTWSFHLHAEAVADAPLIKAINASGNEDTAIKLNLSAALADTDGSETLTVSIIGVPDGATLSRGTCQPDGSWSVSSSDLANLTITPPHDFSGTINLKLRATAQEQNGDAATREQAFSVTVNAVADAPSVVVADAHGLEDISVSLTKLGGALSDIDGSERLSFVLSGVPSGASLSAGIKLWNGSWLLTPAQLTGLSLTPPAEFSGSFKLTLTAVATENVGGSTARTSASFTVSVDPVVDAGTISGNVTGDEDTAIRIQPSFSTPDGDGSETWSTVTEVSGVPAGAHLSHGTTVSPGVWKVATTDLRAGLVTIQPPADSDTDFTLTFKATLTDTGNGKTDSREVTGTFGVTVVAVADASQVTAHDVSGREDQPIALDLSAALRDTDGSETLTVSILGVPQGATLSHGVLQADGSWSVSPADLGHLTITPPRDFSGTIDLTVRAASHETSNTSTATTEASFHVTVDAVADTPGMRVSLAMGDEDTAIPLNVTAWTADTDGSESIVLFRLADVPDRAVIRAGGMVLTREADGSFLVQPSAIGSLTITPPAQSDRDFTLHMSAISAEPNGSRAESPPMDLPVVVRAVADAPIMNATSASGFEDTGIPLNLTATLPDNDGSEKLSFVITGLPDGALLSVGTYRGPGTWSLTAEEARQAVLIPPADYAGPINLSVTAVTQEQDGGSQASTRVNFTVNVGAVVDAPAVGGLDGTSGNWGTMSGTEDQPIALRLDPGLRDRDGSEHVVGDILITGIPANATLRLSDGSVVTAGSDGFYRISATQMHGVTLTMPHDSDVAATLTIRMTVEDTGGVRQVIGGHIVADPVGDADTPVLTLDPSDGAGHNSTSASAGWIPLHIAAAPSDIDGSESLTMWVRDVPAGASLSAGVPAGNGLWLVPRASLPSLSIRPPAGFGGSITLRVSAVADEREGDQAVLTNPVTVTVTTPVTGGVGGDTSSGSQGQDIDFGSINTVPAPTSSVVGVNQSTTGYMLKGTDGNDTLSGHDGANQLLGGDGDDVIRGYGSSNTTQSDQVVGGAGNDTFEFGSLQELRTTMTNGASDTDTVRLLQGFNTLTDADLANTTTFSGQTNVTSAERLELMTTDAATVTIGSNFALAFGNSAIEAVKTSAFTLNGAGYGKDLTVLSGAGNDAITTGSGKDLIDAGAGNDVIDAGAGDDTIRGGAGSDKIDGGEDIDRVVYAGNRSDYTVVALTNDPEGYQFTVTSKSGSVDKLKNIEFIDFADVTGKPPSTLVTAGAPRAQTPNLTVSDATATEDNAAALSITAATADSDQGQETLGIRIEGVPAGAFLSAGTRDPVTGYWVLRPEELTGLKLTPPADFAGTITLQVTAVSQEATGDQVTRTSNLNVTFTAVADNPVIGASPALGVEDTAVPLNLSVTPGDRDGSESITAVVISGLPQGAHLEGIGITDNGNGTWSVDPSHLADIRVVPPADKYGPFELTVTATAREASNGSTRTISQRVSFSVAAGADAPVVTVHQASGQEDKPIALDLSAALTDTDGSEVLSVVLQGLPEGTRLSAGINNGDGSWTLTPSQLAGLTLTPPSNWSGDITVTMQAHARELSNGSVVTTQKTFQVHVESAADAPLLVTQDIAGREDTAIGLNLSAALADTDGSETLSVSILGVPAGASLSRGVRQNDGSWSVSPADLPHLTITPPRDFSGNFDLTVKATALESSNHTSTSTTATFHVHVEADADAPLVTVHNAVGLEDQPIALNLSAALSDIDGSETLSVTILGIPTGASLSHGVRQEDGSWTVNPADLAHLTITPPLDFSGTLDLSLRAVSKEGSNGSTAVTTTDFHVSVGAVADAPLVHAVNVSGNEDQVIALNLSSALTDTDGSETLSVSILGVPAGAPLSHGTRQSDGSWSVDAADLAHLMLTPPLDYSGPINLTLKAVSQEGSNGSSASTSIAFSVQVNAVADTPTLHAGDVTGREDTAIALNLSAALTDIDGSETLTVSILGVPTGATLSHGTRQADGSWRVSPADLAHLTLTPAHDFSGTLDLTVRATAQEGANGSTATTSATFHVQVDAVADAPIVSVHAAAGFEDQAIALNLSAGLADTDGSELLSVTILGVPAGASLSAGTQQEDGSWSVKPADLAQLTLTPPHDFAGAIDLTMRAVSQESGNGSAATTDATFHVTVAGVADTPVVHAVDVSGSEDQPIALNLSAALVDADGSETLAVSVLGVPEGATLSHGSRQSDGSWSVALADLQHLALTPAHDFSGTLDLTVQATAQEASGGSTAVTTAVFHVYVDGVADTPLVHVADVTGLEDHSIAFNLSTALSDVDGSEAITSVTLSGLPEGFLLSSGTDMGGGVWRVEAENLPGLKLTPAGDWNGTLQLTTEATSTETVSGSASSTTTSFAVTVESENDAPHLALTAPQHADPYDQHASAIGSAQVSDIDSDQLGGATITLHGAQSGDKLDFDGFELRSENGHVLIGDTGVEVVGGGYDPVSGRLTLSGHASPDTYSAVLQSLVLESGDPSGLASGSRSISVTLVDSDGAASAQQSVEIVVDDVTSLPEPQVAVTSSDLAYPDFAADALLLPHDSGGDAIIAGAGTWVDQTDAHTNSDATTPAATDVDQMTVDHSTQLNDLHAELSRVHWS